MFNNVTPEEAGISSKNVLEFFRALDKYKLATHSVIMARGDKIFTECYYKPFDRDYKHRMYSISKSFVSVAIGLAEEEGLLSLDDKFIDYFPEYINENVNDKVRAMTLRDMLKMETATRVGEDWFYSGTDDRCEVYFRKMGDKYPGTLFDYDSSASYMLGVIIEKVTGKTFLDYLKEKFLLDIGFSEDSYCLECPGGHAWGDSAVMCSSRDLLTFARFVMNKGTWNGKRYMNKEYLDEATRYQADTRVQSFTKYGSYGYGYQIWKAPNDGFMFVGMGDQFAVCDPKTDFIFIITSDNQGCDYSRPVMFYALYDLIVNKLGDELPEDKKAYGELSEYINGCELMHMDGPSESSFQKEIDGAVYELEENPMNIEYVKFDFEGKKGTLTYKNLQGEKTLDFGMGYNEFGLFPEDGYSDMVGTKPAPGNKYKCACSAEWSEEKKLVIKVQIIDKYFGNCTMIFGFKDDIVTVFMSKTAEAFMNEYAGLACGKRKE